MIAWRRPDPDAERRRDGVARRVPGAVLRIVRETTTYAVEGVNVSTGCTASISGMCLQMTEGATPCDDTCERKQR